MDTNKLIDFVESSFLCDLLHDKEVTDISYNGNKVFYVNNDYGRLESEIHISEIQARDFLRQIANICEKQFSFQTPILDVSFGKYRLNAIHQSIGKVLDDGCVNFSIRIASEKVLDLNDSNFLDDRLNSLLTFLLSKNESIVIGGLTGCGKTELQKYLITQMEDNTRVIIIDNVMELSHINDNRKDISCWLADENNISQSIQKLVRNALRNNPDWLIVAESRGSEMIEIVNSSLTGHSIITTIHSSSIENMIPRIISMVLMNDKKLDKENIKSDIASSIHLYIYCKKIINSNKSIKRYVEKVAYLSDKGKLLTIYENDGSKIKHFSLPEELRKKYKNDNRFSNVLTKFEGKEDEQ